MYSHVPVNLERLSATQPEYRRDIFAYGTAIKAEEDTVGNGRPGGILRAAVETRPILGPHLFEKGLSLALASRIGRHEWECKEQRLFWNKRDGLGG